MMTNDDNDSTCYQHDPGPSILHPSFRADNHDEEDDTRHQCSTGPSRLTLG